MEKRSDGEMTSVSPLLYFFTVPLFEYEKKYINYRRGGVYRFPFGSPDGE